MIHLGKGEIFIFITQTSENQVQQNTSGSLTICIYSVTKKDYFIECLVCVRRRLGHWGYSREQTTSFSRGVYMPVEGRANNSVG